MLAFFTPAAAAIFKIVCAACLLKYRPSPPRPMVAPLTSSPRELNSDCILRVRSTVHVSVQARSRRQSRPPHR